MSQQRPFDVDLFASLKAAIESVNDEEVIQAMTAVDKNEYRRFITNEIENPQFKTKKQVFDIKAATSALETCTAAVEASTAPEVVVQLYRAKLKNQQLRFELLDAAAHNDDKQFCAASQTLYGRPRRDRFAQLVHHTLAIVPEDVKGEQALDTLTDALSHVAKPAEPLHTDMLPPVVEDTSTPLSAVAVAKIFTEKLQEFSLEGWRIVVDESNTRQLFSVNPSRRVVNVPGDEQLASRPRPLTPIAAEALAAHEVGVHARRAAAGYNSSLQLLGLGLDGYLRGEEGLASYSQQQVEGAEYFYGQDRYLAIGLALGLDGTERDFRSVFSLMHAYYRLMRTVDSDDHETSSRRAWGVCQRIFRGTTGQSVGCVLTRDIAYFAGNVAIWEYITNHPERYPDLFVGKFDPLNDRHVTSLQTLEILPQW